MLINAHIYWYCTYAKSITKKCMETKARLCQNSLHIWQLNIKKGIIQMLDCMHVSSSLKFCVSNYSVSASLLPDVEGLFAIREAPDFCKNEIKICRHPYHMK